MTTDLLELAAAVGRDNAYAGTVVSNHDGDTVAVAVMDPLISTQVVLSVRLLGCNAPELSEPGGKEVRDFLTALIPPGSLVTLSAVHPDKFAGRVDGGLITSAGVDVVMWLIARGYAVAWSGVGVKPHVPWPPVPPTVP